MLAARQVVLLALLGAGPAMAHPSGGPAVAWPLTPHRPGELADRQYRFTWQDTNVFTPTGTVAIDWFYTPVMPPTFQLGATPDDLTGTPIALGIDEQDPTDALVWSTATVATGAYWIWSRVHDLPGETSIRINAFSRGTVVVAHPGDEVPPSVVMVSPKSPFELVDGPTYDVVYESFDPHRSGRVTLEAMRSRGGEDARLIARDLPAADSATVTWALGDAPDGDWILRATLVDERGMRAVAYGRFVVTVLPRADAGPAPDARPDAAAAPDAADLGDYDGGLLPDADPESCATTRAPGTGLLALLMLSLCWAARRGSGGCGRRPDRSRSCSRRPPAR